MIFIGDIHGNIKAHQYLINYFPQTLQIGDFGFGWAKDIPKYDDAHRFIRGNHDQPQLASKHFNYLGNYGHLNPANLFFLSGGWSYDWASRTAGIDWWYDEELDDETFANAIALYKAVRPRVVVTHDLPLEAYKHFTYRNDITQLETLFIARYGHKPRTKNMLQACLEEWQPELWIHGHMHIQMIYNIGKTTFISLPKIDDSQEVTTVLSVDRMDYYTKNDPFVYEYSFINVMMPKYLNLQ